MALHFQPAQRAVYEMTPWKLESEKVSFKLTNPNPKYAIILVIAGDDPTLGHHVDKDLLEIQHGLEGSEDVTALVLADYKATTKVETIVYEYTGQSCTIKAQIPVSIDTGDPRPISDFLAMALNSYSPDTRIALGFWGHGDGVAQDHLDPEENIVPAFIRELPLGTKITKTMFLQHYLAEPVTLRPRVTKAMMPDATSGGLLTNRELSSALTVAFSRSQRTEPVDMIFFDTCSNGAAEVYAELRRYAKTFVASSIVVDETGWDYKNFLKRTQDKQPQTPQDWATLAIESWHRAYGRGYSLTPAQLTALDCDSDFLAKLKIVVDLLHARPSEAQELYSACRLLKGVVGQDESIDIGSLMAALEQSTQDKDLKQACASFTQSFQASLIASSEGPSNIPEKMKLTVWFPRMGDKLKVAGYYQNYKFNKETGWLKVVDNYLNPKNNASAPPIFLIMCIRGLELIAEEPVEQFTYTIHPDSYEPELLVDTPENSEYLENLPEGRYSFKQARNYALATREDFRTFVDVLLSIKRKSGEFSLLESAAKELIIAQGEHLKDLFHHLAKYRPIIHDEYPQYQALYDTLMVYARDAANEGILLFGVGRQGQ